MDDIYIQVTVCNVTIEYKYAHSNVLRIPISCVHCDSCRLSFSLSHSQFAIRNALNRTASCNDHLLDKVSSYLDGKSTQSGTLLHLHPFHPAVAA